MRIVLDTNVVVSVLLRPDGPPGRILDEVLARWITPLYDERILLEYLDVLARPKFRFHPEDVEALLSFVAIANERVRVPPGMAVPPALPDLDDLPFLEVALAGAADALVTGNLKHFPNNAGVAIVTPAELVARLAG